MKASESGGNSRQWQDFIFVRFLEQRNFKIKKGIQTKDELFCGNKALTYKHSSLMSMAKKMGMDRRKKETEKPSNLRK